MTNKETYITAFGITGLLVFVALFLGYIIVSVVSYACSPKVVADPEDCARVMNSNDMAQLFVSYKEQGRLNQWEVLTCSTTGKELAKR